MHLTILLLIISYFLGLILISYFTGKTDSNDAFFKGERKSPWVIVAIGMVGSSLSGVTFISIPGTVELNHFSYMQVVMGYAIGYLIISFVLLPLYYKLNLTSIYTYLLDRLGFYSYKTGAIAFLASKTIGAAFRLFLVANVLQWMVFDHLGVSYSATVILTIVFIWIYTFRAGVKTIIWTDIFQTLFMVASVVITLIILSQVLHINSFSSLYHTIADNPMSQIFYLDDFASGNYFWKSFLSGIFITITMTGLDQDMMQKNLSCKNIRSAQKNMLLLSAILVLINLVFLSLGLLLTLYAQQNQLDYHGDKLFPMIVGLPQMGHITTIFFIVGLIAAAYSSADSALTSLTTSFSVDILNIEKRKHPKRLRKLVHFGFSVVLIITLLSFEKLFKNESIIWELFKAAGYTYGPLLGMYAFGLFTKRQVYDAWVPVFAVISPVLSYILHTNSKTWFNGYEVGFEILIINGLLMFLCLWFIRKRKNSSCANSDNKSFNSEL